MPAEEQFILAGFKHFVSQWRTPFPDLQYTVEFQAAERDLVVTRGTVHGTQTGEYRGRTLQGISPSSKQEMWTMTYIDRIADDKIVESWFNEDTVSRLQQIGALSMPGQAN